MTLVVVGPVTKDLVIIGGDEYDKVGGATYYQSFVFEEFYNDYLAIVNCSSEELVGDFPDLDKVEVILKEDSHFFINDYPDKNNRDIRRQLSNFANIPILKSDLEGILPEKIDAFVLNPLNRFDFPVETIEYLKTFGVPIFVSVQGFLRVPDVEANGKYTIKLDSFDELPVILRGVSSIFLDEHEASIIGFDYDVEEIVVTDGSRGSRIIAGDEIKIDAINCENVVDTTGCGDTYMAAYVTQKLLLKSSKKAGTFASAIASQKIENIGPYNFNK